LAGEWTIEQITNLSGSWCQHGTTTPSQPTRPSASHPKTTWYCDDVLCEATAVGCIDSGLRVRSNGKTVVIAAEPQAVNVGTYETALRVFNSPRTVHIPLVNPGDPDDSGVRIKTSSGIKALKMCYIYY
jgi:hypothetical protein